MAAQGERAWGPAAKAQAHQQPQLPQVKAEASSVPLVNHRSLRLPEDASLASLRCGLCPCSQLSLRGDCMYALHLRLLVARARCHHIYSKGSGLCLMCIPHGNFVLAQLESCCGSSCQPGSD